MLRMISLDWRAMKYYWPRAVVLPLFFIVMGAISPALVLPMGVFGFLSFSVNPFAMEEKGQLDNLYLTLPVSRQTIVNARYALSLIMQLIAFLIGVPAMYLISRMQNAGGSHFGSVYFSMDGKMILLIAVLSFTFYAFLNMCMFPVLFKIGYAKGKAIGFYIPMIFFTVIIYCIMMILFISDTFINIVLDGINWAYEYTGLLAFGILVLGMIFLGISYLLSLRFYSRREF